MSSNEVSPEYKESDNTPKGNLAKLREQILQFGNQAYLDILKEGSRKLEIGDYKKVGVVGKRRVSLFMKDGLASSPECRLEFNEETSGNNRLITPRFYNITYKHLRHPYDPFFKADINLTERSQSVSRVTLNFTAEEERREYDIRPRISYREIAALLGSSHLDDFINSFCAAKEDYAGKTQHRQMKDLSISFGLSGKPHLDTKARFLAPDGTTDDLKFRFGYDSKSNSFTRVVVSQDQYKLFWRVSSTDKMPVGQYINLLRETLNITSV